MIDIQEVKEDVVILEMIMIMIVIDTIVEEEINTEVEINIDVLNLVQDLENARIEKEEDHTPLTMMKNTEEEDGIVEKEMIENHQEWMRG